MKTCQAISAKKTGNQLKLLLYQLISKYILVLIFLNPLDIFAQNFIKTKGQYLLKEPSKQAFCIRGVNMLTFYISDGTGNGTVIQTCCTENTYQHAQFIGINSFRLQLSYRYFENDSNPYFYLQSGWDWLEQQLDFAKKYNIYLILDMHMPQGGLQEGYPEGLSLFDSTELGNRLTFLWKEIATRYKNDTIIAGYDLINEPSVSGPPNKLWNLYQKIIDEIRTVDTNHIIIVERLIESLGDPLSSIDPNIFFKKLMGNHILYDFHFYLPFSYLYQYTPWTNLLDGGNYPGNVIFPSDLVSAYYLFSNSIITGTTLWDQYTSNQQLISNSSVISASPGIHFETSDSLGTVLIDSLTVIEYDGSGNLISIPVVVDFQNINNWEFWSSNGTGKIQPDTTDGVGDNISLKLSNIVNTAGGIFNNNLHFPVNAGNRYEIKGYLRGENVHDSSVVRFMLTLDSSFNRGKIRQFDMNFLRWEIQNLKKIGVENDVPMHVGEWGPFRACFDSVKGGVDYVYDMLKILQENNLNYSFYSYPGIVSDYNGQPDTLYSVINLFKNYFDTITCIVPTITGKVSLKLPGNSIIEISPNPANDYFQIMGNFSNESIVKNLNISIYTVLGKLVFYKDLHKNFEKIDIHLSSGIYFLHLKSKVIDEKRKIVIR